MMVLSTTETCWWLAICNKIYFAKEHSLIYCILENRRFTPMKRQYFPSGGTLLCQYYHKYDFCLLTFHLVSPCDSPWIFPCFTFRIFPVLTVLEPLNGPIFLLLYVFQIHEKAWCFIFWFVKFCSRLSYPSVRTVLYIFSLSCGSGWLLSLQSNCITQWRLRHDPWTI
jgi:hypothetical protein